MKSEFPIGVTYSKFTVAVPTELGAIKRNAEFESTSKLPPVSSVSPKKILVVPPGADVLSPNFSTLSLSLKIPGDAGLKFAETTSITNRKDWTDCCAPALPIFGLWPCNRMKKAMVEWRA